MNEPCFSPKSVEDLHEILEQIASDKPQAAVNFVTSLKEKCNTVARFPEMGARRDELAKGLRVLPVGNYAIYYQPYRDGVRIERVLHGARDIDALFDDKK